MRSREGVDTSESSMRVCLLLADLPLAPVASSIPRSLVPGCAESPQQHTVQPGSLSSCSSGSNMASAGNAVEPQDCGGGGSCRGVPQSCAGQQASQQNPLALEEAKPLSLVMRPSSTATSASKARVPPETPIWQPSPALYPMYSFGLGAPTVHSQSPYVLPPGPRSSA